MERDKLQKMYNLLKDFCEDDGRYRQYYYSLLKVKDNIIWKNYYDNDKNHKHSNIWSCVYDFCKKYNIEERDIIVDLFENNCIYEVITPSCLVHNFRIEKDFWEV